MAGTVTLTKLIERIRDRAKMKNSSFVEDSEITNKINDSIAALYDLIIQHRGEEYFETSSDLVLTSGTSEYDLPSDFYKLVTVLDHNEIPLDPFDRRSKEHKYGYLRYLIANNKFHVNRSDSNQTLKLYYVPLAPVLADGADTADFFNGWERYVITDVAKLLLEEEESDATHLERELLRLEDRIAKSAPKNIARPERVKDVEGTLGYGYREIHEAQY